MTTPRVSIIIPAFGVAETLESAVRSVLDQASPSLEVIIVVDDAVDGSGEIANALGIDRRVQVVLRRQRGGPAVSRNDGLRRATGDYVIFLDGDDAMLPGSLDELMEAFDDDTIAVMGRFCAVDEHGENLDIGTWAAEQLRPVVRRNGQFVESPDGYDVEAILTRLVTPPPGAIMIRRASVLTVGGYDTRLRRSEDLDFIVRLATLGRLTSIDVEVLRYRRAVAQRSAAIRQRQFGRQWTLVSLIVRAPSSSATRRRARGIVSHHVDRAETRWRFGDRSAKDVLAVARSVAIATVFATLGAVVAPLKR